MENLRPTGAVSINIRARHSNATLSIRPRSDWDEADPTLCLMRRAVRLSTSCSTRRFLRSRLIRSRSSKRCLSGRCRRATNCAACSRAKHHGRNDFLPFVAAGAPHK